MNWLTILFLAAVIFETALAIPSWAQKQGQSLNGQIYKSVCSGTGPSVDLARTAATQSCKGSAMQMLQKETSVKGLSIETDSGVAFHQEIQETAKYKNLTCFPEREEVEQSDGAFVVWIQCRFDLSKVTLADSVDEDKTTSSSSTVEKKSLQQDELTRLSTKVVGTPGTYQQGTDQSVLSITSIPQCTDLLVSGKRSRVEKCSSNPTRIILYADDTQIIVRAKGFMPKKINTNLTERKNHESIRVILENE